MAKPLNDLKKRRVPVDLILFIKWDRFSRNAGDAYQMINILRKLGVEPQAIEQPLDLSVPENKMMLAFYLAAPEVENDRRALNTLHGMRRAKKEGRWMGIAPVGYINKITEDGRKYIAAKEPEASHMKWIFNKVATGQYNIEQICAEAKLKGLNRCKNTLWNSLRNPVYCGKINLPGYKDEDSRCVQGLHEPLISESLFYEVQDFLDGKKKNYRTKLGAKEIFQLRGYLICPRCGKLLTGSASKGRKERYYYYHCNSSCGIRFKAENANDLFSKELKKFVPRAGMVEAYKFILNKTYKLRTSTVGNEIKEISEQINKASSDIIKARNLLLNEEIEPGDYREIKIEREKIISTLESKMIDLSREKLNIEPLLNKAFTALSQLDELYLLADVKTKRSITGSIYPEKVVFDGFQYRTTRLNEVVELIYNVDKGFRKKETGQNEKNFDLSSVVPKTGFEPARRFQRYHLKVVRLPISPPGHFLKDGRQK